MFITVTCSKEKCFITKNESRKVEVCGREYFRVRITASASQQIWGLSRTKIILQDFPGPANFTKNSRLSKRRGNPVNNCRQNKHLASMGTNIITCNSAFICKNTQIHLWPKLGEILFTDFWDMMLTRFLAHCPLWPWPLTFRPQNLISTIYEPK